jgi:hypothetical protein
MRLMSFWEHSGVVFVRPDAATIGPSESLPAIAQLGYKNVFFDPKTGEWADERRLAAAHGLDVVAWTRVRNLTDAANLEMACKRWKTKAVAPNVEIEDTREPLLMTRVKELMATVGHGLVITDGWADPIGKFAGFRRWTGSVECFPEEFRPLEDVAGCVLHASAFFHKVVPMLGAYGTKWKGRLPVRSDYAWPHGTPIVVYPGDSVSDWQAWKP